MARPNPNRSRGFFFHCYLFFVRFLFPIKQNKIKKKNTPRIRLTYSSTFSVLYVRKSPYGLVVASLFTRRVSSSIKFEIHPCYGQIHWSLFVEAMAYKNIWGVVKRLSGIAKRENGTLFVFIFCFLGSGARVILVLRSFGDTIVSRSGSKVEQLLPRTVVTYCDTRDREKERDRTRQAGTAG